jgi:hypothetical protein
MDRDEFLKQLDRWTEIFRREAIVLFDKGLGPDKLMATAIVVADAMLTTEVRDRQRRVFAAPASMLPVPPNGGQR